MLEKSRQLSNKIIYLIFFFYFLIGVFIYQDFGLGIEEHFQRKLGFYWLTYFLDFTGFEHIKSIASQKFTDIKTLTPNITDIKTHFFYGIIYDLFLAFIETIFEINGPAIFYFRHLSVFLIFFLSSILFYKILKTRFNNPWASIFGTTIYLLSPKIFGSSFFDGKDIFFLSILSISLFFFTKCIKKTNLFNITIFAIFAALATSSRIFGLIIPLSFFIIVILQTLGSSSLKYLKIFSVFFIIYIIALFLHWPYMWQLNFETLNILDTFKIKTGFKVYFHGEFYNSTNLPQSYIPKLIFIETPIYIIFLFFFGFIYKIKRIFNRIISFENNGSSSNDFWRSNHELIDLYFFINLIIVTMYYFSFNPNLWGGWRHFLFLNIFFSYFSSYSIFLINNFTIKKNYKNLFNAILFLFSLNLVYTLYKLHPYQSLFFNNLIKNENKILYEIDTQSISRSDALKFILKDGKKLKKIKVASASFTPLEDARSIIEKDQWEKIIFLGTSNKDTADYIYSNHLYEVDININKKYDIPKNFKLYKELNLDGIRIYSIFKKDS
ncbi:hypothetical protein CBE37_01775 [bacterium TMED277]|nr:hypothetical protein [Candidatus Pelagibacter sp.]OUX43947.1 MAG: hypothetical protein CBE37_01775 [bacterium TMED277]